MEKYIFRIHTEEMKGRIDKTEDVVCNSFDDACDLLDAKIDELFKSKEVEDFAHVDDDVFVFEYFPKMRATLSVVEA